MEIKEENNTEYQLELETELLMSHITCDELKSQLANKDTMLSALKGFIKEMYSRAVTAERTQKTTIREYTNYHTPDVIPTNPDAGVIAMTKHGNYIVASAIIKGKEPIVVWYNKNTDKPVEIVKWRY